MMEKMQASINCSGRIKISTIEVARRIAESAHMLQTRKNGEPYINHAIRVSDSVSDYGEEAQIVGMLHDVIEDSDEYSLGDLEMAGFNGNIRWAISLCTHSDSESYLDYILEIKKYAKGLRECHAGKIALEVKLADLADNLNGAKGTLRDKYMMAQYVLTH